MNLQIQKYQKVNKYIVFFAIIYVFFFPTSINGNIIGSMWVIRNFTAIVFSVYIASVYNIQKKKFFVAIFFISLLSILTVTTSSFCRNNDFRVSYASLSGFIPTLIFWCIIFKKNNLKGDLAIKLIHIISVILCIWGLGLVLNNSFIISLTKNLYSQLQENMFDNMILLRGKPVMSFGTHSMSAFFLLIVYYYNCVLIKEKKGNNFQYIYMIIFIYLETCLSSNTALLAIAIMTLLFVWSNNSTKAKLIAIFFAVLIIFYFLYTGRLYAFVNEITSGSNSEKHGIEARYFSGIYNGNFYMISHYFGVGFLRSASNFFRMNDSAIIYLFTQGNAPAVIMAYYLMYNFLKKNMCKYANISFALFMIWELVSASTFISPKMIFAQILTIFIINSISTKESDVLDEFEKA